MKKWVAFYSQTGSEIMNISISTGKIPYLLVSNNYEQTTPKVEAWIKSNNIPVIHLHKKAKYWVDYEYLASTLEGQDIIITLHGYLRIIPEEFCLKFKDKIFNGHPALITKYPELKGKDQQETAFLQKEKYPLIGTVIHKVIAELDAGETLLSNEAPNNLVSIEDAYTTLKKMSLELWKEFFDRGLVTRKLLSLFKRKKQ